MDDNLLIEKIISGDENAFKQFVEKYHQMVINICNNILHDVDDSMDVSQEVFIKIYESIDQFRGDSKISTWLYRIAVNKSLNFLRSKKRNNWFSSLDLIFGDEKVQIDPIDDTLQPGKVMEIDESKKILHDALKKLPKKQNAAIALSHFDELSYKKIAEVMNISVSEVGVLINRGKKKLEKIIIDYYKKN
ncbi:MAG TPA: RNA polymerase sigma factor [Bacteroidales bacterium]|nr:RNA polymerase sigma factor [Bacteroidales bacterium]